jgi:hypothetical protein
MLPENDQLADRRKIARSATGDHAGTNADVEH